jgi:hypothetical protein
MEKEFYRVYLDDKSYKEYECGLMVEKTIRNIIENGLVIEDETGKSYYPPHRIYRIDIVKEA